MRKRFGSTTLDPTQPAHHGPRHRGGEARCSLLADVSVRAGFGDRLVCVRYLYDKDKRRRLKTVELIVEEVEWKPRARRPSGRPRDRVGIHIDYAERELRHAVKTAGAI